MTGMSGTERVQMCYLKPAYTFRPVTSNAAPTLANSDTATGVTCTGGENS